MSVAKKRIAVLQQPCAESEERKMKQCLNLSYEKIANFGKKSFGVLVHLHSPSGLFLASVTQLLCIAVLDKSDKCGLSGHSNRRRIPLLATIYHTFTLTPPPSHYFLHYHTPILTVHFNCHKGQVSSTSCTIIGDVH
jgi:hypothetical protein